MRQTAAQLANHLVPHVPVRQWALSLPIPLRTLLAAQPGLVTPVLQMAQRVIARHLLDVAGLKADHGHGGAGSGESKFAQALTQGKSIGRTARTMSGFVVFSRQEPRLRRTASARHNPGTAVREGPPNHDTEIRMNTLRDRRRAPAAAVLVVSMLAAVHPAHADCGNLVGTSTTWNDEVTNGAWDNAANWLNGLPDMGTSACLLNRVATTVQVSGLVNVNNLHTSSGTLLDVSPYSTLDVWGGNFINAGHVTLTNSVLSASNLNGGGTLTMQVWNSNSHSVPKLMSWMNADNIVQGTGIIGGNGLTAFVNGGIVNANVPGRALVFNVQQLPNQRPAIVNTGLLQATGGGILTIQADVDNTGGRILADAATIPIGNAITGGTLLSRNGGSIVGSGATTLTNVTIGAGGTFSAVGPNAVTLVTALHSQGNFSLSGATANLPGNLVLDGGGTVTLANGGALRQRDFNGGFTLSNVNLVIQGAGTVYAQTFVNQGMVNADVAGQLLVVSAAQTTNTGVLMASSGGTLLLSAPYGLFNSGGTILADGGTVLFNRDQPITGGTLATRNGGVVTPLQEATLTNVTVSAGSSYSARAGTITHLVTALDNRGTVNVTGASPQSASLNLQGNLSLGGGGQVTLANNNGLAAIEQVGQPWGGPTLTNVDNTIQGAGSLNVKVANQARGTILANAPGQTLNIYDFGGLTNAGTVQADAGSVLNVWTSFSQTAGVTRANGTIKLRSGESISGGVLVGSGTLQGNVTLAGGTVQPGDVGHPGTLRITGSYAQGASGTFDVGLDGASFGQLAMGGAAQLDGSVRAVCLGLCDYAAGTSWKVLSADGGLTGRFSGDVSATGFMSGSFALDYTHTNEVWLTVTQATVGPPVAEPGTWALMLLGLAGMSRRLRRPERRVRRFGGSPLDPGG